MSYEIYTDYDSGNALLPILYSDMAIGPGTKLLFDGRDPNSYPGAVLPSGAIPAGSYLNNLLNDLPELLLGSVGLPGVGTAGITFSGVANQAVLLPVAAKINMTGGAHFGVSICFKPSAPTGASGSSSIASHITSGAGSDIAWTVTQSATTPTSFQFSSSGFVSALTLTLNTPVWLFADVYINTTANTVRVDLYKDGALVNTGVAQSLPGGWIANNLGDMYIGTAPAYPAKYNGQVGRLHLQNFSISGSKTVAQFLADEQIQISGRFV